MRRRSVLQKGPADGGALLEHTSKLNPQVTASKIGQKKAPEGFELDRKHYYETQSKLDAVNRG